MFTVCSKCNLRLTVTATDLRAAQGYVRCGRCHNVFNALAALADDPARSNEASAAAAAQSQLSAKSAEPPPEASAAAPAESAPRDDPGDTDTSLEFNPASTNINEVFIEAAPNEGTGTFESIILVSEEPDEAEMVAEAQVIAEPIIAPQALSTPVPPVALGVTDVHKMRDALADPVPSPPAATPEAEPPVDVAPAPPVAPASVAPAKPVAAPTPVEISFTDTSLETVSVAAVALDVGAAPAAEIPAPAPLLEAAPAPRPHLPRWAVTAAAVALVLVLMAQVIHHYRADLAESGPLRAPLTALYRNLGAPLEPRWNMASYEIRQLGASTDGAAGNLVVRASISNRATHDQPLPLLRVVMQDRYGNRVAARDLKPAEYLGRGAPQVTLLGAGQRVDVQVALQDPGQIATGFEIDACMPGHDHTVLCANDPGSH
jgi:predicted Zn finger-like uncharacterized protein